MTLPRLGQCGKLLLAPQAWSLSARRAFLLLLPISFPLWLMILLAMGVVVVACMMTRPILFLWSAPPKRLRVRLSGYHSYGSARDANNKIYLITKQPRPDMA